MIRKGRQAFSLVEILIVVMILGILAAIAIPKMSGASILARENSTREDLRTLRTQLNVYKSQHGVFPGYPNGDTTQVPTEAVMLDQLLKHTSASGVVSATASAFYAYGPYLVSFPLNPINGKSSVVMVPDGGAFVPDGLSGWLYQPSTGLIKANNPGVDSSGRSIIDY